MKSVVVIVNYSNSNSNAQEQVDQTYIMVKPDGVQRGLVSFLICSSSFRNREQNNNLSYKRCLSVFIMLIFSSLFFE